MAATTYDVQDSGEISLAAVWRILWAHRVLLLTIMFAGGAIAAAVGLTTEPIYRAEVVVTEVREQAMGGMASLANQLGGLASLAGVNLNSRAAGRDAIALLRSKHLIDEFLTRNDLVAALVGGEPERNSLWWASREFRNNVVSIREDTLAGTITVAVEWTDPQIAAQWANGFVGLANESMRTRAMDEATRSIAYLKEQLDRTDVVELRRAFFNLVEAETKTLMLTNARPEYSFKIIDPARPPELRVWPRRSLMVLVGCLSGLLVGSIVAFILHARSKSRTAVTAHA